MAAPRRALLTVLSLLAAGILWVAAPPSAGAEIGNGDSTFFPVTPCRLIDTRVTGGPIQPGVAARIIRMSDAGACDIPENALSLEATVTAVKPAGSGFLRVAETGTMSGTTFLNYAKGQDATNTGSFAVTPGPPNGGGFSIRTFGSATNVVVDVQGYYVQAETPLGGALYVPATPCRAFDSRVDGDRRPLGVGEVVDLTLMGAGCPVPASAIAAEATLTAVESPGSGFLKVWPAGRSTPNATFLTHVGGRSTTNTGTVSIRPGGGHPNLRIRNYGTATHAVLEVQGWWVPAPAPPATTFTGRRPGCRVLDTRKLGGPVRAGATRNVQITQVPGCNIPVNAVAVEATITAIDQAGSGFARVWPAGGTTPNATFLAFPASGSTGNTGAVTIRPGGGGANLQLRNYGSTAHYVVDIQGWYVPTE